MYLHRLLACCALLCCASLLASPLHIAVREGDKDKLLSLLAKMNLAQIQEQDEQGNTALDLARTFEDVDMMMLIDETIAEKKSRFFASKVKQVKMIKGIPSGIDPLVAGDLAYYFMRGTSIVVDLTSLKVLAKLDTKKLEAGKGLLPWLRHWPRTDERHAGILDICDRHNKALLACKVLDGEDSPVMVFDDCVCLSTSYSIEFLDLERRMPMAQIPLGALADFRRFARSGDTLYVAAHNLRKLFVVDSRHKALIRSIELFDGPGQPVVGGRHLFVPITWGAAISVIDTVTNLFVKNIWVSKGPFLAPSDSFIYARCEDGVIFILDGNSLESTELAKTKAGFDSIESFNLGPYDLVTGQFGKIENLLVDRRSRQVLARFAGDFFYTFLGRDHLFRQTSERGALDVFNVKALQQHQS